MITEINNHKWIMKARKGDLWAHYSSQEKRVGDFGGGGVGNRWLSHPAGLNEGQFIKGSPAKHPHLQRADAPSLKSMMQHVNRCPHQTMEAFQQEMHNMFSTLAAELRHRITARAGTEPLLPDLRPPEPSQQQHSGSWTWVGHHSWRTSIISSTFGAIRPKALQTGKRTKVLCGTNDHQQRSSGYPQGALPRLSLGTSIRLCQRLHKTQDETPIHCYY